MQQELLLTLLVFWSGTTAALVVFLRLWFANSGESFHPHSVEIMPRHRHFIVVGGRTQCRPGFVVQSISAFVAPRGSSSNKSFSVIVTATAVTGFLGSMQWYGSGDANFTELMCSLVGFLGLLMICLSELDVSPERFLDQKYLVVKWLAQRVMDHRFRSQKRTLPKLRPFSFEGVLARIFGRDFSEVLPFPLDDVNDNFRDFLGSHEAMQSYFSDDLQEVDTQEEHAAKFFRTRSAENLKGKLFQQFTRNTAVNQLVHSLGCILYIGLTTCAIVLNDDTEKAVLAVIVFVTFLAFSVSQMLTGGYSPLPHVLRGWILPWNPFFTDKDFMTHLDMALADAEELKSGGKDETYEERHGKSANGGRSRGIRIRKLIRRYNKTTDEKPKEKIAAFTLPDATVALDHIFLRSAREDPAGTISTAGQFMVLCELCAVLAPAVALGLQWLTAPCDGPVLHILFDLFRGFGRCAFEGIQDGVFTDCPLYKHDTFSRCVFPMEEGSGK